MKSQSHRLLYLTVAAIFLASALFVFVGSESSCTVALSFCTSGNVRTDTLASATLFSGMTASASNPAQASLSFSIDNPGSVTYISGLYLVEYPSTPNASKTVTWQVTRDSMSPINFSIDNSINRLASGSVTRFTFYPRTASATNVTRGSTFDYEIDFTNGQSISGSLIAQ